MHSFSWLSWTVPLSGHHIAKPPNRINNNKITQPTPWPKLWNHKYALCPLLPQSSKMKKSLTSFPKIHNTPLIFHSYAFLMEVGIGGTTARVQPCWYCGPLPHAIECVRMCLEGLGGAVTHFFSLSLFLSSSFCLLPFFFFLHFLPPPRGHRRTIRI